MIKALILDIDGVIVGSRSGYNLPLPSPQVMNKLKQLEKKGFKICLCSAKALFGFKKIIQQGKLSGPHIADSGALIFDYKKDKIIKKTFFPKSGLINLMEEVFQLGYYTELYSQKNYYVFKKSKLDFPVFFKKHSKVLQKKPVILQNFQEIKKITGLTKLIVSVNDSNQKDNLIEKLEDFKKQIDFRWSSHPLIKGKEFAIINKKGVSKKNALNFIAGHLGVDFENFLAAGDSLSDWEFMKQCDYRATLENAPEKLKKLVKKNQEKSFIGPDVDEDGILRVFKYFQL
ncbi:MAG: HAD-IIB family hydrolase [Candidatus Moranbacteria bacterium]|nr:HAD-IIB family hydrolase [Candidatus Moranbacteria bacterium]